jgi:hypothetical protein
MLAALLNWPTVLPRTAISPGPEECVSKALLGVQIDEILIKILVVDF